jgi:anion-transporting  ArsA/GET3 family ATPase
VNELGTLAESRSIVVCSGSGGVGKTTTAAALGLAAADLGRRACVVTIDPARRLANALGADHVANEPSPIAGDWPGRLDAVMLDAAGTLDELVRRYSASPEQAERIMRNRIYRNLATALSGTQEYMATEKLFELHESGEYDLVVVDTPPTRHALDFLDAPGRLTGFLDNRIFRLLVTPGRAYLKAVSYATQVLLRTIAKVAGSEIVDDTIAFFQAFDGLEIGFRERAGRVQELLASETTAFVLVVSPRRDSIEEAHFFAGKLRGTGHGVDALVVNRVHPLLHPMHLPAPGAASTDGRTGADPARADPARADPASAWGQIVLNHAQLATVAEREQACLTELVAEVEPAPVVRVPLLEDDVHDLVGLAVVARHLIGEPLPLPRGEDPARQ